MRRLTFLLLLSVAATTLKAQTASIKGSVYDTINKQNLSNTVVALLRAKDSVLYKFTRSDKNGNFSIKNIIPGSYVLMATHQTFADYLANMPLTDTSSEMNIGALPMTLRAHMLEEVIVRQQVAAMRMKGDTLEYAADSFKMRQGATVEEMLRKLPGVQVDKDGKITAQGETVQKVLVDGEEFFGDDPTVATKGLQADAIDKVQVFDKKSDQATFSGIDDGEKTKTINLKLKANKKKGYFGKIDLASDFKERWNNSAMINNFKNKTKLSAYGIMSSTGKTGLDWNERDKYGSGSNMQYDEDNGYFYSFNNDDDLNSSSFYGEGIPRSWSAGLNLSNKMSEDQTINGSYRYNKLNTAGEGRTISQSLLPGNYFVNRDSGNNFSSKERHSVSLNYENKFDSTTSIKFTGSGYSGTTLGTSIYNSSSANAKGVQINNSRRISSSSGDNQNLDINLLLRKKFKKAGRTLSLNIADSYNSSNTNGHIDALVNYYDSTGAFARDSLTDQQKENMSKVNNFNSKLTYTEPLAKKVFAEVNYAFRSNSSTSKRLSYDKTSDGKYEDLNDIYSNHYDFNVLTNSVGTAFRYNGKKLTASAGTDVGFTSFDQKDLMNDTVYTRDYTNLFPRANISYKFTGNTRFSISYNGSTQQPQITQIQPIKDNTNPLIQLVGNPGLKQAFSHRINLNFNTYNVLKQRGFYMWSGFTTTGNAIVTDQTTDTSTGFTTLRYVNRNGNYNYYGGGGYNMKLKKLDMYTSLGFDINGSKYSNVVNGENNTTYNNAPGVRLSFGKDKEKKYNVYYQGSFNYNFSRSSVQQNITTNYWTQEHTVNANVTFLKKFEINSDINFLLRQKTNLFSNNNNVVLWNAYFGRRFLKNDKAIIKIQANDLLNQNKGYSRSINSNTLTETNYQSIQRYFQLAFNWNFSKSAAGAATPQQ